MSFFKRKSEHHRDESTDSRTGPQSYPRESFQSASRPALTGPGGYNQREPLEPTSRNASGNSDGQLQATPGINGLRATPDAHAGHYEPNNFQKPPPSISPSYPWSTRQLVLSPSNVVGSPPGALVSPFPRYGHSLPPVPTQSGHLLIFGGLVRESVRNDLFALDCQDFSAVPVQATGEIPVPRVGHASALVRSVLLVWGGDTKNRIEDEQDEGIYLFNIHTREWTRIMALGARPKGRYGHAVCMSGNTFYVSGGQVDGRFMNDLWGFDLSTLMVAPTWHVVQPANKAPSPRTGHVLVTYQDKLYMFGGTDGAFHYNDTWCLDLSTRLWTELQCIGYIPVPREGHSAALVDDVMYVFGGRDVGGKDLGDLAAFKFTNRRWYTFQNMGPAPSGRSGHAMAAFGKQIFVLGGDSNAAFAQTRTEDPNVIHVLDTAKIKYPPDPPRNTALPAPQNTAEPPESHIRALVTRVVDEEETKTSDRGGPDQSLPSLNGAGPTPDSPELSGPNESRAESLPVHPDSQDAGLSSNHNAARTAPPPPVRPRRADDDTFTHNTTVTRSVSPSGRIPDTSDGEDARSGPYNGTGANLLPNSPMTGDASKRSHAGQTAKEPPADAFYYGSRSPTGTVFSTRGETPVQQYPRNIDTHDLTRVVRENTVLRAALEKVSDGEFREAVPVASASEEDSASSEMLLDHILQLQEDCSRLKVEMVERVEIAFEELGDAERQRDAALQETAYFKARLAILEHESSAELSELDREKIMELEDYLASTQQGKQTLEAQVRELETTLHRITDDLDTWKAEGHTASERAQLAEEGQADLQLELNTAQNRTNQLEVQLREQMAENAANTSLLQQRDLDIESHRTQRDDLHKERSGHLLVIEEIRSALQDAERRSEDLSFKHESAASRAQELEQELQKLQVELAEQKRAANKAMERAVEADAALQSTKGQVEHYRSLTEGGLSQLFSAERTAERSLGTDRGEHPEKSAALAQECASLRKMLNEAGTQIEAAQTNLMRHRQDLQESRSATVKLHNELRGCQKQRNLDSETISQLRAMTASRNEEHQRLREEMSRLQSRCDLLRRLLSDHGISASDEQAEPFLVSASSSDANIHTQEQARSLEAAKLELEQLRKLLRERQGDKDRQEEASASGIDEHGGPPADLAARSIQVRDLELRMTEMELAHKKKLQQVEADYQTAVKYVKGTEKVFRRMKDELTKQKSANAALQSELDAAQGTDGREAGSRTRSALSGRATPTTDGETPRQQQRLASQNAELQRQLEGLREELSALRDVCAGREKEVEITRRRAGEAEAQLEQTRKELERYQGEDTAARTMAEVEQENADLRQENETLNHQVMLLLADDDTTSPRPRSDVDFAKYNRRRSTSSTQGSDEQSRILGGELRTFPSLHSQ